MRVLGADSIAFFHPVERQHDRRQHVSAVAESGIRRLHAEHHVREAQQRLLDCLLQLIRLYFIAHTDSMPRNTGNGFMRIVQKDLCVAVRAEQRIILEQIHVSSLRKLTARPISFLHSIIHVSICKSNPGEICHFRT